MVKEICLFWKSKSSCRILQNHSNVNFKRTLKKGQKTRNIKIQEELKIHLSIKLNP
jgi:hypothetical protein